MSSNRQTPKVDLAQVATFFPFSRREFIKTAFGTAASLGFIGLPNFSLASNATSKKLHGLSAFGELKYPEDYTHYDYAALDAPKGGTFAFAPSNWAFNQNTQTFNTLNTYILKGEAPPRMEGCYDTLMGGTLDEPDSLYCTLSKSVEISEDRNTYIFELRPEARFHDGSPVTASDVAFSYLLLKEKGHPQIAVDLVHLVEANALDDHTFEMKLSGKQSERAILSLASTIPIFSKIFYEKLPFENHVMELPMGSGQYKVGSLSPGLFIEYERDKNYWAQELPFAKGFSHFDTIRIDFFRERQAGFEAFKKGVVKWRQEFTSKTWATEYNFPAVTSGKVVQLEFPDEKRPSLQGWAANSRRAKLADPRTREAIGLAFDFEWTNEKLFYGAYQRSNSIFEQSNFAATGMPSEAELALLNPLKDQLPETVFGEAVMQFKTNGSGRDRRALRKAQELLLAAGWKRDGNIYMDGDGNRLEIEFLIRSQIFERILGPFVENLRTIGIPAQIRLVDPSQFQAKLESFDFDFVGIALSLSATPTKESLKQMFHSESAGRPGSRNYPGVSIPAADRLIDGLDAVKTRQELETAIKALDRVLRAHHFWIPNWFAPNHRVAAWNIFGWKEPKPDYGFVPESTWWIDPEKAAAIDN
ncbi:MAG: extracellular solute-binding protein [Salaquimonas sp.]